jgi:conjugative transfer pilus assembly protein TraH
MRISNLIPARRQVVAGIAASALLLAPVGQVAQANINNEMQQMFNDLGVLGNYNSPGAFKSQSMNLYSGGGLQIRTPIRNYQLMNMKLPTFKAGCGGIDFDMGSLTHINKQQFKQLLQQIGNNTVGLLFQSALASITPLIASKLEWLEDVQRFVNSMNINSCEAAQTLVNGMSGMFDMNSQKACENIGRSTSMFNFDANEARKTCNGSSRGSMNQQAAAAGNDAAIRDINIVWEALKKTNLTKDEKETLMNLTGTAVIFAEGWGPKQYGPTIKDIKTLTRGTSDAGSGKVNVDDWMECQDADCLTIKRIQKTITPYPVLVEQLMSSIANKIANRDTNGPTQTEIGFVNTTSVPVYKMLAITTRGNTGLADQLIGKYKEVVAYDYAFTFITRGYTEAQSIIDTLVTKSAVEDKLKDDIQGRIREAQKGLQSEMQRAYQQLAGMNSVVEDIQRVERQMNTNMPSHLANALSFSLAMARQR